MHIKEHIEIKISLLKISNTPPTQKIQHKLELEL